MYKIFYICLQHRHKGHAVLSSAPNRSMMASSPWEEAYFLSWGELRGAVSGMEVVESVDLELCDTCQPMAEPNYAGSDIRPTPVQASRLPALCSSLYVYLTKRTSTS